jgi:hypothetical protein
MHKTWKLKLEPCQRQGVRGSRIYCTLTLTLTLNWITAEGKTGRRYGAWDQLRWVLGAVLTKHQRWVGRASRKVCGTRVLAIALQRAGRLHRGSEKLEG